MTNNPYLKVSCGILFLALLGGCSSNSVKKAEVNPPVISDKEISKQVQIKKNDIVLDKKIVVPAAPVFAKAPKAAPLRQLARKPVQQQKRVQKRVQRKQVRRPVVRQYAAVKRPVVKRNTRKVIKPRSYSQPRRVIQPRPRPQPRARQTYIQRASLSGDFAGNYKAERFIEKMVARHGYNRQHLNGIISNAQATAWMRKMARKDDRPLRRKKSNKKRSTPSWSRYRSHFLTSRHINAGVAFYKKNRRALERAERQYGVPKEYIMGILGVETIFGGNVGKNRAIDALTTMAFKTTRRSKYFESELESYLLMTRSARLDPLQPKASYAGALGLSQFMPSNIKKYGVDFDGDGSVNLWKPDDAIASIARYFKGHGWRTGEMVAVPARNRGSGYRSLKTGFKHKYSPSRLSSKGVTAKYRHNMKGSMRLVKLRTYSGDELWVGGKNFYVITRYNHSSHYAMAVHQLAQEIKRRIEPGASKIPNRTQPSTPRNDKPISAEEVMRLLSASNEHKGAVDELRNPVLTNSASS